ncbi:MAG: primosomal protein N' [Chloroflexi bacterium HGW-Chloroflexi-8]|nr:MAG: primosomal protein N' [Chloroflexi bacterium HGW-Chloroflexi-8]
MKKYVQVTINLPEIDGFFDYHLPDELIDLVEIGSLILVPFGKQKVQGVVTDFIEIPQVPDTKAVLEILYEKPVVTRNQIDLVKWLARETLSKESTCFQLVLPGGLGQIAESIYRLGESEVTFPLSPLQRKIINILKEKGPQRGRQLDVSLRRTRWKDSIKALILKRIVITEPFLAKPSIKPKYMSFVRLITDPDSVNERYPGDVKITSVIIRRKAVLDLLINENKDLLIQVVYGKTGANRNDLTRLAESGLIEIVELETIRDPLKSMEMISQPIPKLTEDQFFAWERIVKLIEREDTERPIVLHGVTGSGKTEIYLQAVNEIVKKGKQAIVLVPEISLTPQTVQRFQSRFPNKVGVFHSRLSEGERFDTWRRVLSGELSIVVGPRSALFVPFENLGIIILDEVHDDSYFQDDKPPRYSTLMTAKAYGKIAKAHIIYGSATPGVEMMFRARLEKWEIIDLPSRVLAHRKDVQGDFLPLSKVNDDLIYLPLPEVTVVDMRRELKSGNKSIFSRELKSKMQKTLEDGQQIILFLNRRGTATFVFCRSCGYRVNCPRCDLALTYHADQELCICHHCNYQRLLPKKCPQCGSDQIRQFGIGTERVEQEVIKQFPDARVVRMDSGVTKNKGSHLTILSQFASRQADILVGTQMLAKGIDFPFVTLVGVILADVGLGLPDFRAAEKTFQLLTQVAGRAGRSQLGGNVIFQSYQPEHYAIQKASKHDFSSFYQQEIEMRRKLDYPPFTRLIRLEFRSQKEGEAKDRSERMAENIKHWIKDGSYTQTEIIGPVPCFFQKIGGEFRWQIIIRGPKPTELIRTNDMGDAIITVDPISLL